MVPLTPALSAYSAEVASGYVGRAPVERGIIGVFSKGTLIKGGWRDIMKRLTRVIFLVFIFVLWNIPVARAQFTEAGVEKFRVPVDAPDFSLRQLGGGKVSLKELRGKIVLLNFFAPY